MTKIKELIEEKLKNNKHLIIYCIFVTIIISGIFLDTMNKPDTNTFVSDKPVLQIILSPECSHCQIANADIFKNMEVLSNKYTLNPIYVGNIDGQKLKIIGVPTFILYKNGIEVKRAVGFSNTSTLMQELEK